MSTNGFLSVRFGYLAFFVALGSVAPGAAHGAVQSVTVLSEKATEMGGKSYLEVNALMKGMAPDGTYSVPITLLYPENPSECNGTGIVDLINNSGTYLEYTDFCQVAPLFPTDPSLPPTCTAERMLPPVALGRIFLGDDFIARKGYVYLALQHEKPLLDIYNDPHGPFGDPSNDPPLPPLPGISPVPRGTSSMASQTDGYQIVADSAYLIRHLSQYSELPASPCSAGKTIAFGYSRSAMLLRKILTTNSVPNPGFDGSILGGAGKSCYDLAGNPLLPPPFAQPSPAPESMAPALDLYCSSTNRPGSGKVMLVGTETEDQLVYGYLARGETPDYRVYEIAGTAHAPKAVLDSSIVGVMRQNPIATAPVFRAMTENMRGWITAGLQPPPSVTLSDPRGSDPFKPFPAQFLIAYIWPGTLLDVTRFDRDADQNALGGVRLPHVATRLGEKTMGAPLGAYSGVEQDIPLPQAALPGMALGFFGGGGTFDPFDAATLATRYPTHGRYVSGVSRAADYALERRWILEEDRDAYVERASKCPVGQIFNLSKAQLDFCSGL